MLKSSTVGRRRWEWVCFLIYSFFIYLLWLIFFLSYFLGRRGGCGGGGSFVEAIIDVEPFSILEIVKYIF
jgi:hypothetical protein